MLAVFCELEGDAPTDVIEPDGFTVDVDDDAASECSDLEAGTGRGVVLEAFSPS